jgi:hypothetical protein
MKILIISLVLLCLSLPGNTGTSSTSTMKGVWLPIQAVSGYPFWIDFSAAEASAAAQALM